MIVCDGCKNEKCKPVAVNVDTPGKEGKFNRRNDRRIISIEMSCCEGCLDKLLKKLGYMKSWGDFFPTTSTTGDSQ